MTASAPPLRSIPLLLFVEKYLIPVIFFSSAWSQFTRLPLLFALDGAARGGVALFSAAPPMEVGDLYVQVVKIVLIILFNLAVGISLLTSRAPTHRPENWKEIVVPLLATFFSLAVNYLDDLPAPLSLNLLPRELHPSLASVAIVISLFGYGLSIWSTICLGRSFGIFVAVRKVVNHGPYRFVRHPIYLAYIFELSGIIIATFSIASFLLISTQVLLLVYRAGLEENRLASASEDYRIYKTKTGFLWPRVKAG